MRVDDEVLLETSRKYNIRPDSVKCYVFALLDRGLSRREIRFALRHLANPERPQAFASTVRRYERMWREAQGRRAVGGVTGIIPLA